MGRRSRKRAAESPPTTRAERDAARQSRAVAPATSRRGGARPGRRAGRPGIDERPPPAWGSFPLTELVILAGILLIAWGLLSGEGGNERLAAGMILASLGGAELALREHLTGFRSHTTLLASGAAFAVVTAVAVLFGPAKLWLLLTLAIAVFAAGFAGLREVFKRRSGGASFR